MDAALPSAIDPAVLLGGGAVSRVAVAAQLEIARQEISSLRLAQAEAFRSPPDAKGSVPRTAAERTADLVTVKDFGAKGDGAADDTPAFERALAYANQRGQTAGGAGGHGITIMVPGGEYRLPQGLTTPIRRDNVQIVGESSSSATIRGGRGTLFTWGDGRDLVIGGGLRSLRFVYDQPADDALLIATDYTSRQRYEDLQLKKVGAIAVHGHSPERWSSAQFFDRLYGTTADSGRPLFELRHGAGFDWHQSSLFVDGVGYPKGTERHPVAPGTDVLRAGDGSWDTVVLSNLQTNRYHRAISIAPTAASVVNNVFATNCVWDYNAAEALRVDLKGGQAAMLFFSNCWFVGTDTASIFVGGNAGTASGLTFTACLALLSGSHGFWFSGPRVRRVALVGCASLADARLGSGSGVFMDDTQDWSVTGGTFGVDGRPWGTQAEWGVRVGAGCDDYTLTGVAAQGQQGGFSIAGHGEASQARLVAGNRAGRSGKPGYAGLRVVELPPSGQQSLNATGFRKRVYVRGGDVREVRINGIMVHQGTGVTIEVEPGDAYAIAYDQAPELVEQVLA